MKWLIWSNEHGGWWKPNDCGYTHCRSEAGRYDFQRALEIVTQANENLRGEHVANETMCPDWSVPEEDHNDAAEEDALKNRDL